MYRGASRYFFLLLFAIKFSKPFVQFVQNFDHPFLFNHPFCFADFEREAKEHKLGSWNRFDASKDLVQGVSTYEESLYTTPLRPDPSSELSLHAEKIACDITDSIEGETPDTGHHDTITEEEPFSSVRLTESYEFQFEGTNPSSLSQLKTSNKAVKGKCERHVHRSSRTEYDYDKNKLVFPDLTPQGLNFSVVGCCKGRKKKKRPSFPAEYLVRGYC